MTDLRVMLTGARGFTGRHLLRTLTDRGHNVVSIDSDIRVADDLRSELSTKSGDVLIHLAGASFAGGEGASNIYESNFQGTKNLLDAVINQKNDFRLIIVASSASVYGAAPKSPIEESDEIHPNSHYAWSKLATELVCRDYSDYLPIKIVRPFNYTGTGHSDRFVVPKIVKAFATRASSITLGNIDVSREFNDVRDVCNVYEALLRNTTDLRTVNICSGRAVSLRKIIDELKSISGYVPELQIDNALIRKGDPATVIGDPSLLKDHVGDLFRIPMENTVRWMYESLKNT